ncbi:MAG: SPFH domain-containing protein [Deltaproteobacteria bacterium]|nr:SPFH domain-containing protein [Deltaproteobacteria bacterium]
MSFFDRFKPDPSRPRVTVSSFSGGPLKWAILVVGVFGLASCLVGSVTTSVSPSQFAVRQVIVGSGAGIHDEIYGPGVHLVVPGYERLHVFPQNLQVLEFNDDQLQASAEAAYAPSINIQTSEGYRVRVDVTVAYRIVDPYKVFVAVGPGFAYETRLVRPRADVALRQTLGRLDAEQFYDGELRRAAALEAARLLESELTASGIQVWNVMVRHYAYDSRYQSAIEARKIQDQTVFKNRAEAVAAGEEAEKNRVLAEGQAQVDVEAQRGQAEVRKIDADAELYARKKNAEGDLLIALAEAEATRLENEALSAAGASNIVGLQMAEALRSTRVIIVPTDGAKGVNPLDLDAIIGGW